MSKKEAYRPRWQDTPGYKTVVDQKSQLGISPNQQESKTDKGQGNSDAAWPVQPGAAREKERALPLPSNHQKSRTKKVGPTTVNKPRHVPERTLSIPGQQYGHPTKYDYNFPTRRDGVTGGDEEEFDDIYEEDPIDDQFVMEGSEHTSSNPLPKKRQNHSAPAMKKQLAVNYLRDPGKRIRQKIKYKTKLRFDPDNKRYRKYYRQYKDRFKRRGISPFTTPAERTKAWREKQKADAKAKGQSMKEHTKDRKENPKPLRTRKRKPPGSTSRTYSQDDLMANWELLGADWPVNWNTQTKKTEPPSQLDQNYGKGQSRDTGTPRKDPKKQKGESLRAPNLDEKHQPGLFTHHKPPAAGAPNVQVNNPTSGSGKVIPMSYYTDLVNNTQAVPDGRQDRYERNNNFQVKQAATMRDILRRVDNLIQIRAKARPPKLLRTDTKNWMWHWASGDWKVKVQAFKRGNASNLNKLNLRISCNCPFWRWQGPEHWAKKGDYLLGRPVGSAARPKVRDPEHVHPVCKHVYAVLEKSKRFFVRPEKSPLRKLGSQFLVDSDASIEIEVVTEPSPARVAHAYLERQLIERVAARYLARETS